MKAGRSAPRWAGSCKRWARIFPRGRRPSGSIHRAWLELKATFTGHGRHAILASCEYGEDAIQKAYESALSGEHLPEYLSTIVLQEKTELRAVHDEIRALRDQAA
ncbi:PA2169 family four-helix-bundle protein [Puia sp. P3]|uniref:PA2169 family four-helix-bundle protein n=1 Tax=Puia sp. P3 TaxID=3423952 RepID=UPI003D6760E2